jgi:phosphatidylglycerol---prolipoprotein diacylglyceryl transferase
VHAAGGIVLLAVTLPLVLRWLDLPFARFADALTPSVGVVLAVLRVGCLLNGCCLGTVCLAPWGLRFPRTAYVFLAHAQARLVPPDSAWTAPVHPLPLYFAAAALAITGVTRWLLPRRRWDGEVACTGLLLFGLTSFALEFLRADYVGRPMWLGWPMLAWAALGLASSGAAGLLVGGRLPRPTRAVASVGNA